MNSKQEAQTEALSQTPTALHGTIKKVLRPIIRLLLSYQVSFPSLIEMLKTLYVEIAEEDFKVEGKRQTDSRINLLTGVHRKDVKRIREQPTADTTAPKNISIGAQLIATWLGNEDFCHDDGTPRALSVRKSNANSNKGFDDLVRQVCKQDIRPRVILDEWVNLGVAHIGEDNCVVLNTGAFTPQKGLEEKLFFFAKNIHDHISASASNLLADKPSYFDRSVYYDQLSPESIESLRHEANTLGMQALNAMNKKALALQNADSQRSDANHRMNFGVFNYSAEYRQSADDKESTKDA
ncbi:MAG: DUF6502 family protein [Pseudohongiellaceae bacterium]|nr:DUF6502 family protein [Pseudohongiellaceae bacterium]